MSRPSTGISSGAFKDRTRPESDSDEDKEDHRERFKSERKMITLKSTKYTKPIPETLGKLHNVLTNTIFEGKFVFYIPQF